MRKKSTAPKAPKLHLSCPVCMSDNLDMISVRMKKCKSCGFIWNHEVSDRDNLLLIVEHKTKLDKTDRNQPVPQRKEKAS